MKRQNPFLKIVPSQAKAGLWLPLLTASFVVYLAGCGGRPTVEIAAVLPLSGDSALYGKSIRNGIELAYETLKDDPELTYDLVLTIEDSKSDPQHAKEVLGRLYSSSIAAIGGVTSDEALAMVPAAEAADRVLLSPSASSRELSGISKNFFRIFPTSNDEAVAMANFAKESLDLERIVIVAEESAYGKGLAAAIEESFQGAVEIEASLSFSDTSELPALAREAVALRSRILYAAADGEELIELLKALREAGFTGDQDWVLTSSAIATPEVLNRAGAAAERTFLTQTVFDLDSEEEPMRSFVQGYEEKYNARPDFFAAHGYDAFLVIATALKEGGGTLPSDLKKGMRGINNLPAVTGNLQFRESGDVQKFMRVFYVSQGNLEDYVEMMERRREEMEEKKRELERRRRELMRRSR